MSNIGVNVNIKVKVRINVLFDVVKNLCLAFQFPESTIKILHKGIVERQILSSVYAYFLDKNDIAAGMVKFNINWDTHEMYASTELGEKISIREDIPLIDQFANWANDIVNYIKDMQESLQVTKLDVFYRYRDEIHNDAVRDKEADDFLGLVKSTKSVKFSDDNKDEFSRKMKFVSEMLPELDIEIRNNIK